MSSRNRVSKLLDRLDWLEQQVKERQQRLLKEKDLEAAEERRAYETLHHFVTLLPEDLFERVTEALKDEHCPLWVWVKDVFRGRSRLPECLSEEVFRRLVLIRLDEADRCGSFEGICLRCGLQYPMHKYPPLAAWRLEPGCSPNDKPLRYDLPKFFDHRGCPACGASSQVGEMQWVHLIEDGFWHGREIDEPLGKVDQL